MVWGYARVRRADEYLQPGSGGVRALGTYNIARRDGRLMNRLKDKVAIIAGGASGIGAATAQLFYEEGARIALVDLLSSPLTEVAQAIRAACAGASVLEIAVDLGEESAAGMGQYDVAKAGILSMTRTLAFEEAQRGVRVNAVCPGLTLTPLHVRRAATSGKTEHDLRTEIVDVNLQRRWADPREVARPILWLASDEAFFITAATLMVDGGTRV